jgi:uncharacterized protein YbaR (Trm112 family)
MPLSDWLLDILVCPESRKPLIYFEQEGFLFCPASRLRYPIHEDVPSLLAEEATRVEDAESEALLRRALDGALPGSASYR